MLSALIILFLAVSCNKPAENNENGQEQEQPGQPDQPEEPEPDPDPVILEDFKASMPVVENWIFSGRPAVVIHLENPNAVAAPAKLKVRFSTDKGAEVVTIEKETEVAANGTADITVTTESDFAPGFYKAAGFVNGRSAGRFVFGVDPMEIVSAPDKQPDFDEFWQTAKDQLAGLDMNAQLTEIPSRSTAAQKVYFVEMQSVPDGLTGEPVTIRGYYLEPQDGKQYPVLMHFFGYDSQSPGMYACPYGSSNPQYAEFYLSTRGQMINNRKARLRTDGLDVDFVNTYGDWFAFNFGNRDGYYYRGAFMDCVQAVRFMATRPCCDMDNLFGEGSSQGGAFSYAAAALSDYPFSAIAPCVAFLGDFPDYFDIVSWPGDTAKKNKGSMTDDEMFAFLSYFDTKNLATRISCAVLACSGLQDGTCPPHTNLAAFSNLNTTDKEYYFYPKMQHEIPSDWTSKYTIFFKKHLK